MQTERWRRIEELFDAAADLEPDAAIAFLESRCEDPELRAKVAELIRNSAQAESFFAAKPSEPVISESSEHPHIARLLDAGVTGAGLPYVVMDVHAHQTDLGSYVQTAGSTALAGNSVLSANVLLQGGTLSGGGEIVGDLVVDGGTVNPGDPQTLTVDGNYFQTLIGILDFDFAGSSSYDQLWIGGNATLDGVLNVILENGFDANLGTVFHVMTWNGSLTGQFASFNYPHFDDGSRTFIEQFNPNGLDLVVVDASATPEPYTFGLMAAGVFAAFLCGELSKARALKRD